MVEWLACMVCFICLCSVYMCVADGLRLSEVCVNCAFPRNIGSFRNIMCGDINRVKNIFILYIAKCFGTFIHNRIECVTTDRLLLSVVCDCRSSRHRSQHGRQHNTVKAFFLVLSNCISMLTAHNRTSIYVVGTLAATI